MAMQVNIILRSSLTVTRHGLKATRRYYVLAEHSCALGVAACDITEALHPLLVAMSAALLILAMLTATDAALRRFGR